MSWGDDPARDSRTIFDAAQAAAERGDYQLAGTLFSRLIGNPDAQVHVAGLLGLADARYRLDDEEGALQAWISATQAPETPLSWQAWVQLAGARVREGDLVAAARAYREGTEYALRITTRLKGVQRITLLSKELWQRTDFAALHRSLVDIRKLKMFAFAISEDDSKRRLYAASMKS